MATRQYIFKTTGKQVLTKSFFKNIACGIFLFIILIFCEKNSHAQVRVTGHVFAEIVEPTALSAKVNNSHLIKGKDNPGNYEMILAEVKLSGSLNMNINVVVTTSDLIASNGEILPFNAFACPECTEDIRNNIAGEKLFTLKATSGEGIRKQINNTFNGHYNVVFIYN